MKKNNSVLLTFAKQHAGFLLFAVIIIIAMATRLYQLNSLPPGLHADEAANGLDIFRILHNHDWRVIYTTNGPREALFFYLQAIFVAGLGNTILALRIAPALLGIGAVVMVYLYTKDWFGRRSALLAAFLMAINPWVIIITRDGFRASVVPLVIASVAFLAGRAYKSGKWWYYALAGGVFALGFYTYTAYAAFILVPFLALIWLAIKNKQWLIRNAKNIGISILTAAVVLLPLVVTIAKRPAEVSTRAGGTSVFNQEINKGKPLVALFESTGKTLLQYNIAGDTNNRHNLNGEPLLNTFVGIVFILGLLVAFSQIRKLRYALLLAMFFVMLLPVIFTAEGIPHALRSIGTAATVFTLAGIGINYMLEIWYKTFPVNGPARSTGLIVICILLFLTLVQGWRAYFVAWAQDPLTYEAYNEDYINAGQYLIKSGKESTNYLVSDAYPAMIVQYLTNSKVNYNQLDLEGLKQLPLQNGKKIFVFSAGTNSAATIELLKAKYPNGRLMPHYSAFNEKLLFYSYEVE